MNIFVNNSNNIAVDNVKKLPTKQSMIYCCDYLNLFSDYREIKYKKQSLPMVSQNGGQTGGLVFFGYINA